MAMKKVIAATTGVFLALLLSGAAQAESGRFVVEKTDNGYVRMDSKTGEISLCKLEGEQIICKMAADERAALNEDIAALQDRVAALEAKIGNRATVDPDNGLPSDEEFERGMSYMEKFMRRFMGIAKELEAQPDKT